MIFSNLLSRYNSGYSIHQNVYKNSSIVSKNNTSYKIFECSKHNVKGITLVALVVTIVVLLILAGITITMLFGENGIIKKAQDSADATKNAQGDTVNGLANLEDQIGLALGEDVSSLAKLAKTGTIVTERTEVTDKVGNKVVVPKGFRLTTEGATVQDGIVIEDSVGNQFVWIPIGEVTLNDGTTKKEIKLGRYTFDATTGNPTLESGSFQYACYNEDGTPNPTNYTSTVTIKSYFQELPTYREGSDVTSASTSDENATAKNLAEFVESIYGNAESGKEANNGYYIARYEASKNGEKAQSKPNVAVWNKVKQLEAAKASREMYSDTDENIGVKSDLMNSYAWDTVIVYIQEMGINNFANKKNTDVESSSLVNTGANGSDKFCNIYDMVANTKEWTTEYSTYATSSVASPCVYRGGNYHNGDNHTAIRGCSGATSSIINFSFRPTLYVKQG